MIHVNVREMRCLQVDTIISEPMGYMLLNERMIESYLHAKKFMKPNGESILKGIKETLSSQENSSRREAICTWHHSATNSSFLSRTQRQHFGRRAPFMAFVSSRSNRRRSTRTYGSRLWYGMLIAAF